MAGGEGVGLRGFKMFCQRGSEFSLLALCVCVLGGGGGGSGGQIQYLSFREKNNRFPLLLINDWSILQKVQRVTTSLIFFKILLVHS